MRGRQLRNNIYTGMLTSGAADRFEVGLALRLVTHGRRNAL
jgi:hypothetical protein